MATIWVTMMEQPLSRRAWLTSLASGAGTLVAACQGSQGVTEVITPEGRVLQWQGEDLLLLVQGVQPRYRIGDTLRVNVMVNNQSSRLAEVRLRTRLLGRGDQAVVEAEVALLTVKPQDASNVDRELPLGRNLTPGEYTLSVELPPWKLDGREAGRGATVRSTVQLDASSGG